MENESTQGFLFNNEHPFPVGKLFLNPVEYAKAKSEGWNTGPVNAHKAKLAAEKETEKKPVEPDFFDVKPKRKPGRPKRKSKK